MIAVEPIEKLNRHLAALEMRSVLGLATAVELEELGRTGRLVGLDSAHMMYAPSRVRFRRKIKDPRNPARDKIAFDPDDPSIAEWRKEPTDTDLPAVTWQEVDGILTAFYGKYQLVRAPQRGSQLKFVQSPIYETIICGSRGGGKGLSNKELCQTDSGWKRVGDITLEDQLLAPDGTFTKILAIYPQPVQECFSVRFCDGSSVIVDAPHRWLTYSGKNGAKEGWRVKTTQQLFESKIPHFIPLMSAPAPGIAWNGPDPYTLGLILGDGTLTGKNVTVYGHKDDEEEKEYLRLQGFTIKQYRPMCFMAYHTPAQGGEKWRDVLGRCVGDLKKIPQVLLDADPATRLALLQGLMDSDGSIDKEGRCTFSSVSFHLIRGLQYLVRSLGGKATFQWKPKVGQYGSRGGYFRAAVMPCNKFNPFRLTRKASRVKSMIGIRRRIVSITKVEEEAGTCFSVAHPSQLFVVTKAFIVTHNTDAALMRYAQHVGKGYGAAWVGIIFRNTIGELSDVIKKSSAIFPALFGERGAVFNQNNKCWTFAGGEKLYLSYIDRPEDYKRYHGWEVPFMHYEELTNWSDDKCYKMGMSLSRCTNPEVPLIYGGSTNPSGIGHNWVKKRFRLPVPPGNTIGPIIQEFNDRGEQLPLRVAIRSDYHENLVLTQSNPDYMASVCAAATSEQQLKAWRDGSWDVVSGGMFDDLWEPKIHVLPDFDYKKIPGGWRIHRAYDHGSSKPFSVGWWARSNGEDLVYGIDLTTGQKRVVKTIPGDMIRIAEWYGCGSSDNDGLRMEITAIAKGIIAREYEMGIRGRVRQGVADSAIFDDYSPGRSVAGDMTKAGVSWYPADKGPGSRIQGWQQMRNFLKGAMPTIGGVREMPGMFVCARCVDFIRTVPGLPRDSKKIDDVNTAAEDHIGDETRYMLRMRDHVLSQRDF